MNSNEDILVYTFAGILLIAALMLAPSLQKDLFNYYKGVKVHEYFLKKNLRKSIIITLSMALASYVFGFIVTSVNALALQFAFGVTVVVALTVSKILLLGYSKDNNIQQ